MIRWEAVRGCFAKNSIAEKFYGEYDSGIHYDDPDMGIDDPMSVSVARRGSSIQPKTITFRLFKSS